MLRILFDRHNDGSVVFRCTRADGASTWQRHATKSAMFFPFLVEHTVGLFDTERVGGAPPLTAEEFNAIIADLASSDRVESPPSVTDAQLQAVRARISELYDTLASLQSGKALELTFETA